MDNRILSRLKGYFRLPDDFEIDYTLVQDRLSQATIYRVNLEGRRYMVRHQPMDRIDRHFSQQVAIQRVAGRRSLAPKVLVVDEDLRLMVTEWVDDQSFVSKIHDPTLKLDTRASRKTQTTQKAPILQSGNGPHPSRSHYLRPPNLPKPSGSPGG